MVYTRATEITFIMFLIRIYFKTSLHVITNLNKNSKKEQLSQQSSAYDRILQFDEFGNFFRTFWIEFANIRIEFVVLILISREYFLTITTNKD